MAQSKRGQLKRLMTGLTSGAPIDTTDLATLDISTDLAAYYVREGWLARLAHGVYLKAGDTLALRPTLVFLQRRIVALHVGGKSALDWHGIRHYVMQQPVLQLYGWNATQLPTWFVERFPAQYRRKRLFDESPDRLLHAGPFEKQSTAPCVSSPERAFLEMLSEVGLRQSLSEARELAESTYTFRAKVMDELLQRCTSGKTGRLAYGLGRELALPWFAKLALRSDTFGARRRRVRSAERA